MTTQRNKTHILKLWAAMGACTLVALTGCSGTSTPSLATTTVALAAFATTLNLNGSVTLTATLSGGKSPIGVITFLDGGIAMQAVQLNGTTATFTTTGLAAGPNAITAAYAGDPNDAASTSSAVTVTVDVPTTTTVAASPAIASVGDSVTLTATVAAGAYTPTGSVTFSSGSTTLGTAPLAAVNGNQVATLVTTTLPLGTDPITASYPATSYFLASNSAATSVQIHAALIPTTTALATLPSSTIASGTLTTLAATLTPASVGATAPTGTITFYDGSVNLGSIAIASDAATLATKQFNVGANSLTAVYSGDAVYAASTSTAQTVTMSAYTGATYTNPLPLTGPGSTGAAYSCPDPAIIKYQATAGVDTWYAYCTGDVLNSADNKLHNISIFSSSDLVHWTYVRDAFATLPSWIAAGNELGTPAIIYLNGSYHLYYYNGAPTASGPGGPAIGVGTAATPAGPFTDSGTPVIAWSAACGGGCDRTTYSPEVINDGTGQYWMVYGGIYGGISIRKLSADGLSSDATTEINVGVDNYYQHPYIWKHGDYFYEFLTAGSPYGGPYASDNVHVGRSKSITGPYNDAEGNDVNAYSTPATQFAPGGDPVLMMNGNDIVGAGSNVIFTDEAGQDYILYSGISKKQPYLPNYGGYNARQLMMDAIDWTNGWPRARNGFGPSDYTTPQPVPAAQPNATNGYVTPLYQQDAPGTLMASFSDDFNESTLNTTQWTFLHAPATYTMTGTAYQVQSVADESVYLPTMQALPILSEPAPTGNYLVEIKVSTTSSPTAFYTTNQQAGLFIYSGDENYLRLDEFPNFDTRQIEYLNQYGPGILGSGTSLYEYAFAPVGTPNFYASTYLRIAHRVGTNGNPDTYTSYSSTDGITYLTGPTWTASYPSGVKLGLFAGNTAGYTVTFDYIHVSTLLP